MCEHGTTTRVYLLRTSASGGPPAYGPVEVDACIAPLVAALNDAGFRTVASCCGHGRRPGSIALADGRCLSIYADRAEWERAEGLWPLTIHGEPRRAGTGWAACRVACPACQAVQTADELVATVDAGGGVVLQCGHCGRGLGPATPVRSLVPAGRVVEGGT